MIATDCYHANRPNVVRWFMRVCSLQGEARLAVKDYTSERAVAYGPQNLWYHVDCFSLKRADVGFTKDMNPDK